MVKYSHSNLDCTFGALADPTRRAILARLARGDMSVTELAGPFKVSLPAISKHLRVLERAGLLRQEKDGRVRRCRLMARPMKDAAAWIEHYRRFWEEQLDALAEYLEHKQGKGDGSWPPTRRRRTSVSRSKGTLQRRGKKSSGPGPTQKR